METKTESKHPNQYLALLFGTLLNIGALVILFTYVIQNEANKTALALWFGVLVVYTAAGLYENKADVPRPWRITRDVIVLVTGLFMMNAYLL